MDPLGECSTVVQYFSAFKSTTPGRVKIENKIIKI